MSERKFTHSGFFALRTPLLPLEFLQTWGSGTPTEDELRGRLRGFFDAPDLRDALFVASPAVEEALRRDGATKDIDKRDRLDASLTKYLMRMAGRCTPFGLFAGVSVGTFSDRTELRLAPRSRYRRYTRIDMGYLAMLVDGLMKDARVRHTVRYRRNSTLYVTAGRARYVEHRPGKRARSYFLVSADLDESLKEVLDRSAEGVTFEELASALARDGITIEEARLYVDELIQGQVLEPDLAPAVTAGDPMEDLETQLARTSDLQDVRDVLASVRSRLTAMDAGGVGAEPGTYREIADVLKPLPADANIDRLFQVDMAKPPETLTLSESILDEIARVASALERLFGGAPNDPFESFKKAFTERYSDREIPLLEALDEECGVGFGSGRSIQSETAPLLAGLFFPSVAGEQRVAWGGLQNYLLRRLTEPRDPAEPIRLKEEDLARFQPRSQPLPNAYSVMLSLLPSGEDGAPRFLWQGLGGPSGACLLGRFCHTDEDLLRGVREHLRQEEALDPERLYCEIVHLPEGRTGNVIARPPLRDHEIVFLARPGAKEEHQIPLSDLLLSLRDGRIVLRSRLLGREIAPRLTNAHNYSMGIGVYRFLAMLQRQGGQAGLGWHWGPFESLPALPRVEYGNVILSPARWNVSATDVRVGKKDSIPDQARKFQEWAGERRLPRWLGLREGDNVLPVDRENTFSVRAMMDAVDRRPSFELVELPWMGERGMVEGPEGTFANEIVIPLVRTVVAKPDSPQGAVSSGRARRSESAASLFIPGSEWLFSRWNTAPGYGDAVLVEALAPVVRLLRSEGVADSWFFIRYADPDFHIRLRLRGNPAALAAGALPRLREIGEDLLGRGLITKVTYDTYDREVNRYGGFHGIELCEAMFRADSDAALDLIASTLGDEGAIARWRLALCGMNYLMCDAGLDLEQRYFFAQRRAENYMREFRLQGDARHPIQDKLRVERRALLPLLNGAGEGVSDLGPGFEILGRRSRELQPLLAELKRRDDAGELTASFEDILASLIHMHANRVLATSARAQEAVLYRFLEELYDSMLAREGKKKRDRAAAKSEAGKEAVVEHG
ncbi:MAG TPA: lantibiotic dehydratase [Candidatus Eisenbacteria bacterium]|nr:lantibiotic dehydratase [Candidatus Eisenbacteria bacterium]